MTYNSGDYFSIPTEKKKFSRLMTMPLIFITGLQDLWSPIWVCQRFRIIFPVMLLALPKLFQCPEGRKRLACFAPILVGLFSLLWEDTILTVSRTKKAQATAPWVHVTSLAYGPKGHELWLYCDYYVGILFPGNADDVLIIHNKWKSQCCVYSLRWGWG